MKVRILCSHVGAGFSHKRGTILEVGDGEAARMIAAGNAEAVMPGRGQKIEATARLGGRERADLGGRELRGGSPPATAGGDPPATTGPDPPDTPEA